ncbi:MAG: hypothetical protein RR799_09495 [Lachnospiraceae bacterium]
MLWMMKTVIGKQYGIEPEMIQSLRQAEGFSGGIVIGHLDVYTWIIKQDKEK